eukprot:scaffold234606_cov27-Prasinocladus_malaysianus.AAC.1
MSSGAAPVSAISWGANSCTEVHTAVPITRAIKTEADRMFRASFTDSSLDFVLSFSAVAISEVVDIPWLVHM